MNAALDIPDPTEPSHWKFQTYMSWKGPPTAQDLQDPGVRMKHVRDTIKEFCEPFRTAFLAVDESEIMPVYSGQQWVSSSECNPLL